MSGRDYYREIQYDREKAVKYAQRWALNRNPAYYNYDNLGGDCTNFASQSLYAGSGVMNYTPVFGWYYIDADNKAPAWTGVKYFYNFLTSNLGVGPFGVQSDQQNIKPGDFVQLFREGFYTHTLIITDIKSHGLLVSSHTADSLNRPLQSYIAETVRFIHIHGVRIWQSGK